MAPVHGQGCRFGVASEEPVDRGRRDRLASALATHEKVNVRRVSELREVGPQEPPGRRMDWVLAGNPALLARDPDAAFGKVFAPDERCFPSPETVPVDDVEKQPIAGVFARDHAKEPLDFLLREVGNLLRGGWLGEAHFGSLLLAGSHLDAFTHFRELARCVSHRYILRSEARRLREALALASAVFFSLVAVSAQAEHLPALFEAVSTSSSRVRVNSIGESRFKLNRQALRADRFELLVGGKAFQASAVDAEVRAEGAARFFRLEGARELSVSTETFDYTIVRLQLPDGSARKVVAPTFGVATITPLDLRPRPDSVRQASASTVSGRRHAALPVPVTSEVPVVRQMFVYPPEALSQKTAALLHAEFQAKVDSVNGMARDSGVATKGRYQLVYDGVVAGTPKGKDDLDYVSSDSEVAALRYGAQADEVGYVPVSASSIQDIAWCPYRYDEFVPAEGFFVSSLFSFDGGYTVEHEMLHGLGLQHNVENVVSNSFDQFTTAREHVIPAIHSQGVMGSYVGPYGDELHVSYNRYPRFSNPDPSFTWQGYATGSATENNAGMYAIGMQFVPHYHEALKMR